MNATAALSSTPVAAAPAPDHGILRDLPREHGYAPLRVEGRLPGDLEGTLYRNGAALFTLFGRPYKHWFDGDGAVTAVRLSGGRAEGACRLVYDATRHESHLAVVDARRPEEGPVCRLWFDHHVPPTFHGAWRPARSVS